jgi:tRNA nucleotidyltransferase/poly(A) polymerase
MSKLKHDIKSFVPDSIVAIIRIIENKGFDVYIVGGAIRDILLGRYPTEYDLASNATPEQIEALFDNVSLDGKAYGTIRIHHDGVTTEVTTFRNESQYDDARHPNRIEFISSIEDDLLRRDFTINALAYSYSDDKLIDQCNSMTDLKNKLLVCVGEPSCRFKEDTLRPYRAFRFMSQLGFRLDASIIEVLPGLVDCQQPSVERIRQEMDRLLLGKFWLSALNAMNQVGWLKCVIQSDGVISQQDCPHHLLFRWAWLLSHGDFKRLASRFQFSKKDTRIMADIIQWDFDEYALSISMKDVMITSTELNDYGFFGVELGQLKQLLLTKIRKKELPNTRSNLHEFIMGYLKKRD